MITCILFQFQVLKWPCEQSQTKIKGEQNGSVSRMEFEMSCKTNVSLHKDTSTGNHDVKSVGFLGSNLNH
jgi:hypothetical protein